MELVRYIHLNPLSAGLVDTVVRDVALSFRRMTEKERASLKVTRVRVITVKAGDKLKRCRSSAKMAQCVMRK